MMKSGLYGLLLICVLVLVGCNMGPGSGPASRGGEITRRPVALPPAYPPPQAEPADPQLRQLAIDQIQLAASANNPFLRAHAMEAARHLPPAQATQILLTGVEDSAAVVRFAALMAAGEIRLPEARPVALRLVNDPDKSIQAAAIYVLHTQGDTRFSRRLEGFSTDSDRDVRANTAIVVGQLREPTGYRILRHLMRDQDEMVRLQAAEGLWLMRDNEARNHLVIATVSRYPDDQMIAVLALAGPRDRRVAEHMRGMLTSHFPEVSLAAARAMGLIGSDEGYGVATNGVTSDDARQRLLAAMAFGDIGRIDAQVMLGRLLIDDDPTVRIAAANFILQLHTGR